MLQGLRHAHGICRVFDRNHDDIGWRMGVVCCGVQCSLNAQERFGSHGHGIDDRCDVTAMLG